MKIYQVQTRIIATIVLIVGFTSSVRSQQKISSKKQIPALFEKFKYTSDQAILEQHSYFNFTDRSSVGPDLKKFGIRTVFTPPYFINPFMASFTIFDKEVEVESYEWYPSESVFKGNILNGISSTARVVPMEDKRGGIYEVVLTNTTSETLEVPIVWNLQGKPGRVKHWGFYGNRTMTASKSNATVTGIDSGCRFTLDGAEASIVGYGANYEFGPESSLRTTATLEPGESIKTGIVFMVDENQGKTPQMAKSVADAVDANIDATRTYWVQELNTIMDKAPKLEGVSEEFQAFYNTGLLSLQSAKWKVPEFIFNPWYGSCGIDGGAMISYLWEMSYSSKYVSMISPAATRKHLLAYAKADMGNSYAVDPESGKGVGPLYSYNYYNLARLAYDYVSLTGDFSLLDEPVDEGTYLEYLYNFCLSKENLDKPAALIDYGSTHNLLEMYKTNAYSHYVPSPNAERVLTYEMLTELYGLKGKHTPDNLMKRKAQLTKAFRKELWNEKLGWLNTLDANKKRQLCYSVQCFSPLRSGILTKNMEKALVGHLNEEEFLSPWGIYSLSPNDKGYDPGDVDWGGPGIYTAAAPELISDLLTSGFFDKGLDILNRILWWGELPYMPQAMRANIKGYRENGRANLISGVCNAQNMVYGLFGLKISTNAIKIHPIKHDFMKGVSLKNLRVRDRTIDVEVDPDGKSYMVSVDGKKSTIPANKSFSLKFDDLN